MGAVHAPVAAEAAWRRRYRATRLGFPTWSRDDPDRLLYLSNANGRFEVYAWDRRGGAHRQVTDRAEGTGYRVPSRLDPNGTHIWWFDDAKGNELGHWVREPFAGGRRETIAEDLPPAYSAWLALGSSFAVLGRSRAEEGTTVYVLDDHAPAKLIYAHRQSANVSDLSRDETLIAIAHSEHGDSRNRAVRIVDRGGRALAELWDGPGKGLQPVRFSPVPGDQRLLVLHDRRGRRQPLLLDARSGRVDDVELDLPGETFAEWYPDAASLLIGHEHGGRGELYRVDLGTRRLERIPTEAGTIATARVRPDGDVWYQWTDAATPAEIRSVRDGVVIRPPGERPPAGVPYAEEDADGVHLFVAEPTGPRPHPTIFIVHGGPEAHDQDAYSAQVQAWVDHGFAVVLVNYRGSSGYGKAWRDAIVGRPGLTELEDLARVHDLLVRRGVVDRARTILSGGSWGGYLTLLGLGVQPERWALGIGIVPIGDYVAAFDDEMEPLKRYDAALFGGTPAEVPESYHRSNPLTYVERVRVPMLLLVGQNDPRCPSRSVYIYADRLRALGKPPDEYRYDAGHGSLVIDEQIKQMTMELAFAARHLGTRPPIA